MGVVLKMQPVTAQVRRPRPFQTLYYRHAKFQYDDWTRVGRASSGIGAIRAAVVNVLRGKYKAADIYGDDGVRLYQIRMTTGKLFIIGYFGDLEDVDG